jgi:hypothetical protein
MATSTAWQRPIEHDKWVLRLDAGTLAFPAATVLIRHDCEFDITKFVNEIRQIICHARHVILVVVVVVVEVNGC